MFTIHVAHAIGRKGGTHYRARAFAQRDGVRCSYAIAIDDTPEEATSRAIQYVRDMYIRDGLVPPDGVIDHGRKPGAVVDGLLF